MTDLLNTGKRIRHFRILCGMTQKALGMAVGFPQDSADVRIAQYESGARMPKQNLLYQRCSAFLPRNLLFLVSKVTRNYVVC